jgi:hypothetical protein
MSSTDEGNGPRQVQRGRKAGRSTRGAPFGPGRSQRDGPERPTRHVPTEADAGPQNQPEAPPPTAAQEEDEDGT